jgi:acyl-CoA thioesterase YciA
VTEANAIEIGDPARSEPRGTLSIRTLAMPSDTNQYGDIFGGWLLGQMDIAGGIFASTIAKGRTATIAVDGMTFRKPVNVGDVICIYTELLRIGTTSITVRSRPGSYARVKLAAFW